MKSLASFRAAIPYVLLLFATQLSLLCVVGRQPVRLWGASFALWLALSRLMRVSGRDAVPGLVIVLTFVLVRLNLPGTPVRGQLYGLTAVALCALPFLLRPLSRSTDFPFLHLFCLVQAVYIYVGFLVGRPGNTAYTTYTMGMRQEGLLTYAGFMLVVVVAGILVQSRPVQRAASSPDAPLVATVVFPRAVALFLLGFLGPRLLNAVGVGNSLGAVTNLISLLRVLGYVAFVALWIRKQLSPAQRIFVVAIGIVDVVVGFGTGLLYNGALLAFAAFAFFLAERRRIAWLALLVAIPGLLMLGVAKKDFRDRVREKRVSNNAFVAGLQFIDIAQESVINPSSDNIQVSAERFGFADMLGYLRVNVPRVYPYWDKRSYTLLPLTLIPRVLVPFKPTFHLANEFGRKYRIAAAEDFATSDNTPIPVEAYVNFGVWGIVGVGLFCGLVLGALGRKWTSTSLMERSLGAIVAAQLLGGIESGMAAWVLVPVIILSFRPAARWLVTSSPVARKIPPHALAR